MLEKTNGQNPVANPTIVDTDILIDAGHGISDAVICLQNLKSSSSLAISIVTQMELIVGCANKAELKILDNFITPFDVIKIDQHKRHLW